MEAFSLLKYWRGGGGVGTTTSPTPNSTTAAANTTTILAAVPQNETTTESDNDEDEGPFFDLEFTVPDEVDENPNLTENNQQEDEEEEESDDDDDDDEREYKITLSPSSNDRSDGNLSLSPSEDLFFNGKLVHVVEPSSSSFVLNNNNPNSEPNSKPPPQFTSSLLKSATKFRVFMLGLKKPKQDSVTPNPHHLTESQKKQERIKFKVEEVPIVSLFTRDNSSRGNNNKSQAQNQKQNAEEEPQPPPLPSISSEEKRLVMHKYLKMVKPLYIRVSRRYSHGDKLGAKTATEKETEAATGTATVTEAEGETVAESNVKSQKQGNLPAGLRVVYKHLGKSRSASSAVAAASPPAVVSSKRRDDSLLQQQDGIQGAILHCKRSFNASRERESSQLPRSVSDPLREIISPELLSSKKSVEEGRRKS